MLARYVRQLVLNSRSHKTFKSGLLPWFAGGLLSVFVVLQNPAWLGLLAIAGFLYWRFPSYFSTLATHPQFKPFMNWKVLGVSLGVLLFVSITNHADPAMAQLFNTAEQQANSIFGQYLDQSIIGFLFGTMRIVVWVSAVGFIFFAVYQAQRGEQWQPLLQNAFIIIAAVVVVEGLSRLFFGKA